MLRFNLFLLVVAIVCALGTVTAQHRARKLFVTLEKEQQRGKQLEVEFGQLQLEAGTWGMQARIEKIAVGKLNLRTPSPNRVQIIGPGEEAGTQ
jgi:cell division protein FtsL